MMSYQLSEGVIHKILKGENVPYPVFQILGYKKVPGDRNDRYRLLISDGKCAYPFAILGTNLAGLISSGSLEKFSVVRVNNYACTTLTPMKKIITILGLEIISPGSKIEQRIGHPVPISNQSGTSSSPDSNTFPTKSSANSTPKLKIHQQSDDSPKVPTDPDLGSTNVAPSPNTFHQAEHQAPGSSNVPTSPNTYHGLGQQAGYSTNVATSPNGNPKFEHQFLGSANVPTSLNSLEQLSVVSCNAPLFPDACHKLEHQAVCSTSVPPASKVCHKLEHQDFSSSDVPTSPNTYELGQQAVCSTYVATSPNGNHKLEHQFLGSANVPSLNACNVLEQQRIGSSNLPISPDSYHKLEHQAVCSTSVPPASNACHKLEHKALSSANVPTSPSAHNVVPISRLTPYQNKWTIRARVTNKSKIREYNTSRGSGKFFSVDFTDESGEIRATAFNESVDKFYHLLETNEVYYVSKARLKFAEKQFTTIKNDFEMNFTSCTTVVPCEDNLGSIPSLQFNFVPIYQIDNLEKNSMVDVIGVCKNFRDVETIVSKTSFKELRKRNILLIDQSCTEISLTLWDNFAEDFNGSSHPVVAVKGARITDFNYCSLSTMISSAVLINPDIEETRVLRKWFDTVGRYIEPISVSHPTDSSLIMRRWKTLAEAKEEVQGSVLCEPQYYKVKATVLNAKRENCMYMSCPADGCSKKVNSLPSGKYECTRCGCEYDNFNWKLLLRVSLADFSDEEWATCFDQMAESLLNKSAQELQMLRESNEDAFDEFFSKITFRSYIFDLRSKMEVYNDESQLKTTVLAANPVSPVDFSTKLICDIKQMEKML